MGRRRGRLNARGWRPKLRSAGNSGSKPVVPAEAAVRIEGAGQEAAMARLPSQRIVATLFKRFDAQHWRDRAKTEGKDVLIVDTSGRLHVDEALMAELVKIRVAQ